MKKLLLATLILIAVFVSLPNLAGAAGGEDNPASSCPDGQTCLDNPLGKDKTNIPQFLGQIISYALGIIGSLALVMIIYGGATWMLSRGNDEMIKKGKSTIVWAAFGLAVIFTSYALVRFVITAIGNAQ